MYKLMNWNTIEYFEEKEDCLEACLTATLDLYKQDFAALANAIYTKSYFVACKGGYVDEQRMTATFTQKRKCWNSCGILLAARRIGTNLQKKKICLIQEKLTRSKKIRVGLTILTTKFQN